MSVVTPIWQKSDTGLTERFRETPYVAALAQFERFAAKEGISGYDADVIGRTVWHALTTAKPHVRYAIVPNRLTNWIIPQLLPKRILDSLVARFMGIRRRK